MSALFLMSGLKCSDLLMDRLQTVHVSETLSKLLLDTSEAAAMDTAVGRGLKYCTCTVWFASEKTNQWRLVEFFFGRAFQSISANIPDDSMQKSIKHAFSTLT